eukprot:m.190960 g.190960  ORF g.190960 m.190960 type:complete len:69 (-) comp32415_c9_seq2:2567-2773(-)
MCEYTVVFFLHGIRDPVNHVTKSNLQIPQTHVLAPKSKATNNDTNTNTRNNTTNKQTTSNEKIIPTNT